MMKRTAIAVAAGLVLVACSGEEGGRPRGPDSATGDAAPAADSGMAGMKHSTMGQSARGESAPSGRGDMSATDHARMSEGASGAAPRDGPNPTAAMDHSTMPGMRATGQTSARSVDRPSGVDHSRMPGMQAVPSRRGGANVMAGMDHEASAAIGRGTPGTSRRATMDRAASGAVPMDHSNMPGMGGSPVPGSSRAGGVPGSGPLASPHGMPAPPIQDPGTAKLVQLVAKLVQDSVVRRRLQVDSVLRNRWNDPDVREALGIP